MARALQSEVSNARGSSIEAELASNRRKDMSNVKTNYRFIASALLVLLLAATPAAAGFEEGLELLRAGKYTEAASVFQVLVDEAPEYADGYHLLGLCFMKTNKLADAEKNILKAIELNGDNFVFHYNLANTYASMGKHDKVIKTLNGAESLAPAAQKSLVAKLRSQSHVALRQWNEAIPDLQAALAAKSDPAMQTQLGKAFFVTGDSAKAVSALQKAVAAKPDATSHKLLIEAMIEIAAKSSGKSAKKTAYDKALAEAKKFKAASTGSFDAEYLVGRTALGAGQYDSAIGSFKTALTKKPTHCNAKTNLGNAYAGKADWTHAISTLNDATKCDPKSSVAWSYMGFALQKSASESKNEADKQKFYTDAIAAYRKAAAISPSSSISTAIATCEQNLAISQENQQTDHEAQAEADAIAEEARRVAEEEAKREAWKDKQDDDD